MTMLNVDLDALRKGINARPVDTHGDVVIDVAGDPSGAVVTLRSQDQPTGGAVTWVVERPSQIGKLLAETAAGVTFQAKCWIINQSVKSAEVFSTLLPGAWTSLDPRDVSRTTTVFIVHNQGSRLAISQPSLALKSESRQLPDNDRVRLAKQRWASELPRRIAAMKAVLSLAPEPDAPTPATDDD